MKQFISTIALILFLALGIYLTNPSEEQLARCYERYSADYCNVIIFE